MTTFYFAGTAGKRSIIICIDAAIMSNRVYII